MVEERVNSFEGYRYVPTIVVVPESPPSLRATVHIPALNQEFTCDYGGNGEIVMLAHLKLCMSNLKSLILSIWHAGSTPSSRVKAHLVSCSAHIGTSPCVYATNREYEREGTDFLVEITVHCV
jgi:hypothetical protein